MTGTTTTRIRRGLGLAVACAALAVPATAQAKGGPPIAYQEETTVTHHAPAYPGLVPVPQIDATPVSQNDSGVVPHKGFRVSSRVAPAPPTSFPGDAARDLVKGHVRHETGRTVVVATNGQAAEDSFDWTYALLGAGAAGLLLLAGMGGAMIARETGKLGYR